MATNHISNGHRVENNDHKMDNDGVTGCPLRCYMSVSLIGLHRNLCASRHQRLFVAIIAVVLIGLLAAVIVCGTVVVIVETEVNSVEGNCVFH